MLARMRPLLVVLLVLASGCSGIASLVSPRRANGTPVFGGGRGNTTQPTTTSPAGNDAQAFLNRLDAHLRAQSFTPSGAAIRNSQMPSTGLVAYAVDAQPGRCYAAIGIGDSGTDLNMVVLDPFGRQEGHNVAADTTPWVSFCPRAQGRYIVRLQMSRGSGGYYYLAYGGPGQRDPQLASFFGGSGGSTPTTPANTPQTASLDAATRGRIEAAEATLRADNFTRVSEPIGLQLTEGQERVFPLNLSTDACYAFGSFGGAGTSDTDVFITDGTGDELASDIRGDRDALARFCPPTNGTYQLRTRLYTGDGAVFVTGWAQARRTASSGGTGSTPVATPPATGVLSSGSVAATGLTEAYALLDIDMQARGYAILGDPQNGELATGANREFAINVESDKCYAIVAIGDSGVRNIDLTLVDGGGRTIDSETEVSGRAFVRTCSSSTGARTVRLAMATGTGNYKFAVYQFTRGTRGPFGLSGLTWVRLSEVTALLQAENFEPSIDFDIETGRLTTNRAATANLTLGANKCYAIVVAGGDGVSAVSVALERSGASVAENTTGSSFPDVRTCTTSVTAGRHTLRITATTGAGPYAFQVFERPVQ